MEVEETVTQYNEKELQLQEETHKTPTEIRLERIIKIRKIVTKIVDLIFRLISPVLMLIDKIKERNK